MTLPALLIATCLVHGQATSPNGRPLSGVGVVHAPTGALLALTADDGTFDVQSPDAGAVDLVLEFRAAGHAPVVRRVPCGDRLDVRLQPRVYELEPLDISATRLERSYESAPVHVERLGEEAVAEAAASSPSLAQAVQQLSGVGAVGRDAFTAAPVIRGLGRDRSLILLEGMRLSSDRGVGPTGSFVDPFLIRSVDVVRGASGVAYGSGAIGGVVSVGLGDVPAERHASLRVSGQTNGEGRLVAGRGGGPLGGGWRATGGAFLRTLEDYAFPGDGPLAAGDARNSGFENGGGVLAVERAAGAGGIRVTVVGTTADDVGRPTTRDGRLDAIETEDHLLIAARWSESGDRRRTEAGVGFHRPRTVNRTERFDAAGTPTRTGRTENESWDVSVSGLVERPRGGGSWLAGVDAFARLGVDATETNVLFPSGGAGGPGGPSVRALVDGGFRADVGVFAGTKRTIGYLGELLLAGRLDWAGRDATDRSSAGWISPSVTAGISVPLSAQWALTGSAGRSFRAPRIQELYFAGDRPGGSRLANPDLEPETAWSAETGARWSDGPWSASAVLFGIFADELIVQLPVDAAGDTLRNENEMRGTVVGAEAELLWSDPEGHGRAGVSYARLRGENEDGGSLPDIPPGEIRFTGEWRVYSSGDRSAVVKTAVRAGGGKTPLPVGADERWWSGAVGRSGTGGDEEGHPGYARWDGGVRAQLGRRARVDVAVSNILDSRYIDRAERDAFPQPGRSLQVSLTLGE